MTYRMFLLAWGAVFVGVSLYAMRQCMAMLDEDKPERIKMRAHRAQVAGGIVVGLGLVMAVVNTVHTAA